MRADKCGGCRAANSCKAWRGTTRPPALWAVMPAPSGCVLVDREQPMAGERDPLAAAVRPGIFDFKPGMHPVHAIGRGEIRVRPDEFDGELVGAAAQQPRRRRAAPLRRAIDG